MSQQRIEPDRDEVPSPPRDLTREILELAKLVASEQMTLAQAVAVCEKSEFASAATPEDCLRLAHFIDDFASKLGKAIILPALLVEAFASKLNDLGRRGEAINLYDAVFPAMCQHSPPEMVAEFEMHRANVLCDLGRYAEAMAGYDAALRMFRGLVQPADVARCQMNRGRSLKGQGRYAEAVTCYDAALPLLQSYGLEADAARCLLNRANALKEQGRYAEAEAGYDAALPLLQAHGPPTDVALCHESRASVLRRQARYAEAVAGYDAALLLLQAHGLEVDMARCQMDRAGALHGQGRYGEAEAGYDAALPLLQAHGLEADVALCQMNRANSLAMQGRYAEAEAGYDAALPLYQTHGPPTDGARCQMNRANSLAMQGRYAEAVAGYEHIDLSLLEPEARRMAHHGFGYSLWGLGEQDRAMDQYRAARRAMRRARRLARVDETRYEFMDHQRGVVRDSVQCALEANRADEAFAAVQDGKAGMLGEVRRRIHESADDEPAAVIAARAAFTDLLRNPPDHDATRDEWAKWNVERTRLAAEFLDGWGRHHHAYRERSDDTDGEPSRLAEVQSALPDDWAILDFWQTSKSEFVSFIVTRDELDVERLELADTMTRDGGTIGRFLNSVQGETPGNQDEVVDDLDDCLFKPLRRRLHDRGVRGLYLVPHGILQLLPLHASRDTDRAGRPRYLCDEFAVAYLPSSAMLPTLPRLDLALLPAKASKRPHAGDAILSLANPDHGNERFTLPFSEWEGRELKRRLGCAAGQFHAGADATLDRTAVWPPGGLVHFTCHGFGDSALAPVSHLRLADDVLLAHDVAYRRPPLAAGSLVILNGCQTSVPDWRAVDDGMGLATAFLVHGAGVVLATSWSVADGCAAKMALKFVGELLNRGANPTDALREAQRHVRELSAEQILAWCDEVKHGFPESDCPAEAMKIHAQAAFVSKRSGLDSAARHHGDHAARLLRQLNCPAAADRILALTRAGATTGRRVNQRGFNEPTFWAAFQLIGRVT